MSTSTILSSRRRAVSAPRAPRRRRRAVLAAAGAVLLAGAVSGVAQWSSPDLQFAANLPTASTVSADWAGWEVTGGTYTSVAASWTVPTVTCSPGQTAYSAHWVGLDGDGSDSVEQIGTSSDCASGTAQYTAWYEFYPAASVQLSASTVHAGDAMTALVTSISGSAGSYRLVLTDRTRHWTKTVTGQAPQAEDASAEIISEAPSEGRSGNVLPLADFHRQIFTGVTVNGRPIGSLTGTRRVDLADRAGTALASTSAVSGGNTFTVTWKASGAETDIASVPVGAGSGSTPGIDPSAYPDGWGDSGGIPVSPDTIRSAAGSGSDPGWAFFWGGAW